MLYFENKTMVHTTQVIIYLYHYLLDSRYKSFPNIHFVVEIQNYLF